MLTNNAHYSQLSQAKNFKLFCFAQHIDNVDSFKDHVQANIEQQYPDIKEDQMSQLVTALYEELTNEMPKSASGRPLRAPANKNYNLDQQYIVTPEKPEKKSLFCV